MMQAEEPNDFHTLLVTGASGFVGRHLLPALVERWPRASLHATTTRQGLDGETFFSSALRPVQRRDGRVCWHRLDIRSFERVSALVRTLQPDAVVHLAAQSHVPTSFQNPELTWQVNLQGTLNLLESVKRHSPGTLVLNVGSSDMYGGAFREGRAVDEYTAFQPLNPYAASKAAADLAAGQYAYSEGLRVLRARPFNHTGPGQSDRFVLAAFASQIARIEAGKQPAVVETGNLDAERDFLDIEDVVNAYLALLALPANRQEGQPYNIASGRPVVIQELLDALLEKAKCQISHRIDPKRQRPSDIHTVVANVSAFHDATGWKPQVSIEAMLSRLLEGCRRRATSR